MILKIETCNPIRSFKGRGADFLLSQETSGRTMMCASAGNFGQAMAYTCRKQKRKLIVYAATKANTYKIERMRSLGAEVILHGEDFDASKEEARCVAAEQGHVMIEDALAIETVEGAGTIGLELTAIPDIDVLLISLGNGALFNGIATAFKALSPRTKRIAVQAAGAPAMAESWRTKELVTYRQINTIADGIGVRIPIQQALVDMAPLADDVITVKEDSILQAMNLILSHAGVICEPSGAIGIAAILEDKHRFSGLKVATVICGGNLTEAQRTSWLK